MRSAQVKVAVSCFTCTWVSQHPAADYIQGVRK